MTSFEVNTVWLMVTRFAKRLSGSDWNMRNSPTDQSPDPMGTLLETSISICCGGFRMMSWGDTAVMFTGPGRGRGGLKSHAQPSGAHSTCTYPLSPHIRMRNRYVCKTTALHDVTQTYTSPVHSTVWTRSNSATMILNEASIYVIYRRVLGSSHTLRFAQTSQGSIFRCFRSLKAESCQNI